VPEVELEVVSELPGTARFEVLANAACLHLEVEQGLDAKVLLPADGTEPVPLAAGLEHESTLGHVYGRWPNALWVEGFQPSSLVRADAHYLAHGLVWKLDRFQHARLLSGWGFTTAGAALLSDQQSLLVWEHYDLGGNESRFRRLGVDGSVLPGPAPTVQSHTECPSDASCPAFAVMAWSAQPDGSSVGLVQGNGPVSLAVWPAEGGPARLLALPIEDASGAVLAELGPTRIFVGHGAGVLSSDGQRFSALDTTALRVDAEHPLRVLGARAGRIWIASQDGLYAGDEKALRFVASGQVRQGSSHQSVSYVDVWQSDQGRLWAIGVTADYKTFLVATTSAEHATPSVPLSEVVRQAVEARRAAARCEHPWSQLITARKRPELPLHQAHRRELAELGGLARRAEERFGPLVAQFSVGEALREGRRVVVAVAETQAAALELAKLQGKPFECEPLELSVRYDWDVAESAWVMVE
jgi:hypothetical protein